VEEKALAPREEKVPELVSPIAPVDAIVQRFKDLEELKRKLLSTEDYYLTERGTYELKIRGWRKLAVAFGLSTDPPVEELERDPQDPREIRVRMEVTVHHARGRTVTGTGWFSSREVKHKWLEDGSCVHPTRVDKSGAPIPVPLEHTVASRAYTRALKRAVQDMVGPIELEEEELEEPVEAASKAPTPTPPSTSPPRTTAPQRVDAGQRAIVVRFLEDVLGEDLVELLTLEESDGDLKVILPAPMAEANRTRFLKAMMAIGQGVSETSRGLVARMKAPRG